MDYELASALRKRAVAAIEESNTILNVAENLLKQGNQREAARLRNEARIKRNESILLMDQASGLERGSFNVLQFGRKGTATNSVDSSSESVEGNSTEKRAGGRRFRTG